MQSQVRFNRICVHLTHGNIAEVLPALGLAARFRTFCKDKTLRLLGIPSKLMFYNQWDKNGYQKWDISYGSLLGKLNSGLTS